MAILLGVLPEKPIYVGLFLLWIIGCSKWEEVGYNSIEVGRSGKK